MKTSTYNDFKSEYIDDIKNFEITPADLKKFKVSNDVLAGEIFLNRIYGDDVRFNEEDDLVEGKSSEVKKLSEEEMSDNSEINRIYDDINASKATEFLLKFMAKVEE